MQSGSGAIEPPLRPRRVDGEMSRRGRAHIAGSAIAARFARFADCPASAGVPCHNGLVSLPAEFCGDRYWGRGRPPYY